MPKVVGKGSAVGGGEAVGVGLGDGVGEGGIVIVCVLLQPLVLPLNSYGVS